MDLISDMIARIKNAIKVKKQLVDVPLTKINISLLRILYEEGYILGYKIQNFKTIQVYLKYNLNGSVITEITRISKPGNRQYISNLDNYLVNNGLGIFILSTSNGLMTNEKAKRHSLGGEILCKIA